MAVGLEQAVELNGTVGQVMSTDCLTAPSTMSAAEGANRLADANHRHLFVVDEQQRLLGVISHRDILKFLVNSLSDQREDEAQADDDNTRPWELGSLIARKPITVELDTTLAGVAVALTTYEVGCLPVVDDQQRLLGAVGINDLLRHLGGLLEDKPEEEFCIFKPKQEARRFQTPAFFRKANGALVIPKGTLAEGDFTPAFALLGFDQPNGRILVKFTTEKEDGGRKVTSDPDNYVIPASDFTSHFDIRTSGNAYDVTKTRQPNYLILTPKQASGRLTE